MKMEKDKLISMTDFVIKQSWSYGNGFTNLTYYQKETEKYANFLKQPLTISMFVPVDGDGNVLLMPGSAPIYTHSNKYMDDYKKARQNVLFCGFEFIKAHDNGIRYTYNGETYFIEYGNKRFVEDLLRLSSVFNLTPNAIKQIYG